jgi:hypothetical protein
VVDVLEISRVRRRPRPSKALDQTARTARLKLEREIFREPLIPLLLKFKEDQLQRIDDERRVASRGPEPKRVKSGRRSCRFAKLLFPTTIRQRVQTSHVARGTPHRAESGTSGILSFSMSLACSAWAKLSASSFDTKLGRSRGRRWSR